jgi:hypothetical protein
MIEYRPLWEREKESVQGPNYRTRVSVLKDAKGIFYIDIRKWIKYNSGEMGPTKKGICLSADDWNETSAMLQEAMIESGRLKDVVTVT